MAKQTSPLFHRLLKKVVSPVKALKQKMRRMKNPELTLETIPQKVKAATTEYEQEKNPTQWVLAETSDKDNKNRNVVVVQVEAFPHTTSSLSADTARLVLQNYTIDGEDPNLRITHYPSNRLH